MTRRQEQPLFGHQGHFGEGGHQDWAEALNFSDWVILKEASSLIELAKPFWREWQEWAEELIGQLDYPEGFENVGLEAIDFPNKKEATKQIPDMTAAIKPVSLTWPPGKEKHSLKATAYQKSEPPYFSLQFPTSGPGSRKRSLDSIHLSTNRGTVLADRILIYHQPWGNFNLLQTEIRHDLLDPETIHLEQIVRGNTFCNDPTFPFRYRNFVLQKMTVELGPEDLRGKCQFAFDDRWGWEYYENPLPIIGFSARELEEVPLEILSLRPALKYQDRRTFPPSSISVPPQVR